MKKAVLICSLAFLTVISSHAQKSEVYVSSDNIALNGYDVVAFFTDSQPVKGISSNYFEWNKAIWYFSTAEHLESFRSDPEKFAPQFGGYCAFGTSEGHKAPTEADTWSIVNGKLYLNYNMDVKKIWIKNKEALIEKANSNWVTLKDTE